MRAGYDAWKSRATQRGRRASARRRLDEAVAWEHEVSGGTYGAPRIRRALARSGVDVGVRAVAASMRRQGLTGLNTPPRPPVGPRRPGPGVDHGPPTCAAPKAGSTCARCALAPSPGIRHGRAAQHALWSSPRSTWPPPPVVPSPLGSCSTLIGEHNSPPRNWPPTCAP